MNTTPDPRIEKLEAWMANLHTAIFDTSMYAQAIVANAQKTLRDVEDTNDDYQQLKRDYEIAVSLYRGKHEHIDQLIDATEAMRTHHKTPNIHVAQCYAAGTCAITCQRMLDAVPDELRDDQEVVGGLNEKSNGHFTMWRHLAGVMPGV